MSAGPIAEVRALLRAVPSPDALRDACESLDCTLGVDEFEDGKFAAYAERDSTLVAEGYGTTPEEARARLAIELGAIVVKANAWAERACRETAAAVQATHARAMEGSE